MFDEKFYLPDNLIFCCKIALLGCALLSVFFWEEQNTVTSFETLPFPSESLEWIHPTPVPCLSLLAQRKKIFFWHYNLRKWEVKLYWADRAKKKSVSMLWEQLHDLGHFFVWPVQGGSSCVAPILEWSLFLVNFVCYTMNHGNAILCY